MYIDTKSMMLWGENGACGGHIKVHLRGSALATVTEVSLTYIGLQNTDYWLGRVRQQLDEIFDEIKAPLDTTESKDGKPHD